MENKNGTILIVDDTRSNLDLLIELLQDYDIVVAIDGKSALDILEEDDSIDLILLDIMMPQINGFEVCKIIKQNSKISDIPIIFLTAKSDEDSIKRGFEVGGVDYIIKPFRPVELFARIKTHINLVKHEKKEREFNKRVALKELINNISHHWKQPLSVISTAASGMKLQKEIGTLSDKNFYQSCDSVIDSVKYLASTIEGFEQLMNRDEKVGLFCLYKLIEDNLNLFSYKMEDNMDYIHIDIQKDIMVHGIKTELLQVLLHIINNAKDALQDNENKLIFLKAIKNNNNICINIYDNGGGIPKSSIDKVFDPYFTSKHKSFGKGLGLYSVYNIIVYSFNGHIKVSNIEFKYEDKKYKGANFEIQIPNN